MESSKYPQTEFLDPIPGAISYGRIPTDLAFDRRVAELHELVVAAPERVTAEANALLAIAVDYPSRISILLVRSFASRLAQQHESAFEDIRMAIELALKFRPTQVPFLILIHLAGLVRDENNFETAATVLESVLESIPEDLDPKVRLYALQEAGENALNMGQFDRALEYLSFGHELATTLEDERNMHWCMNLLGKVSLAKGQWIVARKYLEHTRNYYLETGQFANLADLDADTGRSKLGEGDIDAAELWLERAMVLARRHGLKKLEIEVRIAMADIAQRSEDIEESNRHLTQAYKLAMAADGPFDMARVYAGYGNHYHALRRREQALHYRLMEREIIREQKLRSSARAEEILRMINDTLRPG